MNEKIPPTEKRFYQIGRKNQEEKGGSRGRSSNHSLFGL
jgi:hypothetical protein